MQVARMNGRILSPAGLEPTTYGLKVPESTLQYSRFEGAHETDEELGRLLQLLLNG